MATRRSWLQNLTQGFSGIIGKDEEVGYFFGLQLLIHAFGEDALRSRLAEIIADTNASIEDTEAKRRYIKRLVAVLIEQQAYWSQVFWDYKTTASASDAEFEAWSSELNANTATESEEMNVEVDGAYRLSNAKDYVSISIILRLSTAYPPATISDENLYWQTQTVNNLVRGLLLINPETIIADGVFITPGNSEDGLSEQDLLTGGWSYLRVMT